MKKLSNRQNHYRWAGVFVSMIRMFIGFISCQDYFANIVKSKLPQLTVLAAGFYKSELVHGTLNSLVPDKSLSEHRN